MLLFILFVFLADTCSYHQWFSHIFLYGKNHLEDEEDESHDLNQGLQRGGTSHHEQPGMQNILLKEGRHFFLYLYIRIIIRSGKGWMGIAFLSPHLYSANLASLSLFKLNKRGHKIYMYSVFMYAISYLNIFYNS